MQSLPNPYGKTKAGLQSLARSFQPGLVSVIIPCYNSASYIAQAIESALDQSYPSVEVIVVDDGSTDTSLDVIRSFGDRIHWKSTSNHGACHARNEGLSLARGEYIQFLDSDDALLPASIEDRIEAFDDETDAVFGNSQDIDQAGRPIALWPDSTHDHWPCEDICYYIIHENIQTMQPLHRRKNLYEIGGWDEALPCGQEPNLHLRLACHGHRFRHIDAVVSLRRHHGSPNRISNVTWVRSDPMRYVKVGQSMIAVVAASKTTKLTAPFVKHVARVIWLNVLLASGLVPFSLARKYYQQADRISPGFTLNTGRLGNLLQALLGTFYTGYLAHVLRRSVIQISGVPWPFGPRYGNGDRDTGLVNHLLSLLRL